MTRVLCVSLSRLEEQAYSNLYRRASQSRREKADTLRQPEDKYRCLLGEALLRYALGTDAFTLSQGEYGKPYAAEMPEIHFNISHSGPWVVLAISQREVGIDIEVIRPDIKTEKLARRHFTPGEQAYVFSGEESQLADRFFRIWTAKESYLKYLGTGLSRSLQSVDVISMDFPHFFTQTLEDCRLTLCTEDTTFALEQLSPEQL